MILTIDVGTREYRMNNFAESQTLIACAQISLLISNDSQMMLVTKCVERLGAVNLECTQPAVMIEITLCRQGSAIHVNSSLAST